MSNITISKRQLVGLYGFTEALVRTGGQFGIGGGSNGETLTSEEMHDLYRRLRELASPLPPLAVEEIELEIK